MPHSNGYRYDAGLMLTIPVVNMKPHTPSPRVIPIGISSPAGAADCLVPMRGHDRGDVHHEGPAPEQALLVQLLGHKEGPELRTKRNGMTVTYGALASELSDV